MNKTKVVHMTSGHSPFDVRIFQKECKTLAQNGYDVVLIAQHDKDETVDGVKILGIRKAQGRLKRMILTTWRVFRRACNENASLYHFHEPELFLAALLLKLLGKKVVYDNHEDTPRDIIDKTYIPKHIRNIVSKIAKIAESTIGRIIDRIVIVDGNMGFHYPQNKKVIIHNFPQNSDVFNKTPSRYSTRQNIAVYIGGLSKSRGIYDMINAIDLVPNHFNVKLMLAGPLSDSLHHDLSLLQGWQKVEYRGFLNREQIREMLDSSKIGLIVLHAVPQYFNHAFAVKTFEYMANKIPIIGSDFPVWREFYDPIGCMKFVQPTNPEEIAKAIIWLLENPDKAEQMGKKGYQAVLKKYNWEIESKNLISMYNNILHRKLTRKVINS